jgi:uncharacterized membrane protein YidH (DUF202 family)
LIASAGGDFQSRAPALTSAFFLQIVHVRSSANLKGRRARFGITAIVVCSLAVVFMVLHYQRNQNQIDEMPGVTADA